MRLSCAECGGVCGELSGLGIGFDPTSLIGPIANKLIGGGSSGSGMMTGAGGGISVSPSIQTSISPQISPVFIQQDSPTNSAINAGTSQYQPSNMTASPNDPFGGAGLPSAGSGYGIPGTSTGYGSMPTGLPNFPQTTSDNTKYIPLVIGGVALIGIAVYLRSRKNTNKKA